MIIGIIAIRMAVRIISHCLTKAPAKLATASGNGLNPVSLPQNQQRQEVVVPDPDPVQNQHSGMNRLQNGRDDHIEGFHPAAAVYLGRLFQFKRDALDKPVVEKNRQG